MRREEGDLLPDGAGGKPSPHGRLTRKKGPSVLDLPARRNAPHSFLAGTAAVLVHAALVAIAMAAATRVATNVLPVAISQMVEIELPSEPPAQTEPAADLPKEQVTRPKPIMPKAERELTKSEAPAPAAAEAGQILAATEEVVDFADSFVTGPSRSYAGGVTESLGTDKRAVSEVNARAVGVEGGTGTDLRADLSRPPRLAGKAVWDCPFPPEADDAGVDHAVVSLSIDVSSEGKVTSVTITRDPGDGFAREARRCAREKHWEPGLDRAGQPIRAVTPLTVRFDR